MKNKFFIFGLIFISILSCSSEEKQKSENFINGFDGSMLSILLENGEKFYDEKNIQKNPLQILKENGINFIRLRLWNEPDSSMPGNNDLTRTLNFAREIKKYGLNLLLDFHFSDSWADPKNQIAPKSFSECKNASEVAQKIKNFVEKTLTELKNINCEPKIIQIGNEIDSGILTSGIAENLKGDIQNHKENFILYLKSAFESCKKICPNAEIMIHISSGGNKEISDYVLSVIKNKINYDLIGLSWYPFYKSHKTLYDLTENIEFLSKKYKKSVIVAETSFAWTLWQSGKSDNINDELYYGNEEKGLCCAYNAFLDKDGKIPSDFETESFENKLCLSATEKNQYKVLKKIINSTKTSGGIGVFYWGGDWITSEKIKSNWENQALFDFDNKILNSVKAFN